MISLFKVIGIVILIVIIVNHWDVAVDFVKGIVDWIIYGMKIISTGPPKG